MTANPRYRAKTLRTAIDIIIEAGESIAIPVPARTLATCTFAINKFGNRTGATTAQSSTVGDVIGFTAEVRSRLVVVGWQTISGMFHTTRSHAVFLDPDVDEAACDIYHHDDKDVWSVDMLNLAATKEYLNQIHERYRVRVSEYFGNTLKGFFYDEPKAPSPQPWTDDFAERFAAIKGYDLTPFLPDILIDIIQDGATFNRQLREEAVQRAAADYRDVWTTLIAESFSRPIQDWCRKHGVVATGHQQVARPIDGLPVKRRLEERSRRSHIAGGQRAMSKWHGVLRGIRGEPSGPRSRATNSLQQHTETGPEISASGEESRLGRHGQRRQQQGNDAGTDDHPVDDTQARCGISSDVDRCERIRAWLPDPGGHELDDDPESDFGFASDFEPELVSDFVPDWESDFEVLESDDDFSESDFWACLSALAASLYDWLR